MFGTKVIDEQLRVILLLTGPQRLNNDLWQQQCIMLNASLVRRILVFAYHILSQQTCKWSWINVNAFGLFKAHLSARFLNVGTQQKQNSSHRTKSYTMTVRCKKTTHYIYSYSDVHMRDFVAKHDKSILCFSDKLFFILRTWLKTFIWHCIMVTTAVYNISNW